MTGFPQIATHVVMADLVLQKNCVTPEDEDDEDDDDSDSVGMLIVPEESQMDGLNEAFGPISAGPDDSDPPEE